jgi:hypothetical protein
MTHHQNAGKCNIKIANRAFENASEFRYLGMTVTNRNLTFEEIKRRLNLGSACYHSVQKLHSLLLFPMNVKIEICRTTTIICL